ncbi:MAG: hypothetical protein WC570_00025 [Patescibacteria group bacterium]
MENDQTTIYDALFEKYFTKRNLIIAAIFIILFTASTFIWQWFYQATIIIKPNTDEVTIHIESSPTENNSFTVTRNEVITKENIDNFSIKVEPNLYYYIITSKDGYTTHEEMVHPSIHQTITIAPILIKPIIGNNISQPTISNDQQQIIYIDQITNQLSSQSLTNQEVTTLNQDSWYGVENIIYSPDKTKFIIKVKNNITAFAGGFSHPEDDPEKPTPASPFYRPEITNETITTWTYNLENQTLSYLNPSIKNIAWLNNDQIIYEYLNITGKIGQPGFSIENTLNIADHDGSNWQVIQTLNNTAYLTPKIIPSPTNPDLTLLLPNPSESGQNISTAIYLLNTKTNHIEQITENNIIDASWSPEGNKIIYAQLDQSNHKPLLYIIDIDSREITSLNIYSYICKTHWLTNEKIAIAIPTSRFDPTSTSPDNIFEDYYSNPQPETFDTIYIVNVNQPEQKTNLFANNFRYLIGIHNIFNTNTQIYFQDTSDKLYTLPLLK